MTFNAAVDKLAMDEKMFGNAPTRPATATTLLSYRPRDPAPASTHGGQGSFGSPGSPFPNQGNQKRKWHSNHGGYNNGSTSQVPPQQTQRPTWIGMV
jgi:hypothetical protein